MCARPGYQPRAKVFESYPRRHPGESSYAYDPPSLFLSHEFYPPRFSKNPPQNSAEREIFLESFSFPHRLLSAETDFARIPSYEQSFVSSEIAGRSPTIKRIRSAVYNHETNFDLSSPLDCPRTLHPLSSPKSHRRNGGRGKNRLPGVFRDPEGLIAFLDTSRQRYSFRPRNPNRATLSPLRTKGIRRYLNFLSLQDNLPFFSLKKREVAILIPLFPLELSLWNIGRVSTLFRRTGTVVAGRKRGGGS